MKSITREQLNEKLQDDVVLVEVLPPESYREYHLPKAINVPLGDDFDKNIRHAVPDRSRPVVVYCYDQECTASPTAAARLDELGYEHVYDYAAGKVDWKQAGLPVEA